MKRCPKCGAACPRPGQKFCSNCGAPLSETPPQATSSWPPAAFVHRKHLSMIAGGVVLCILLFNTPTDTYITYAMNRILDTGIGVLAAIFVNGMLPGGFTFSFMHRLYQRLGIRDDVEDEFMAKPAV